MWDRIHSLKLGEKMITEDGYASITRVPGGWVYVSTGIQGRCCTFIPYSDEFYEYDEPTEEEE